MWSVTVSANKSQFSTIIKTANIMSRPSFGTCLPVSMTADIITTLMLMTESVRIRVPYDSSNLKARHSACFTTPKESQKKRRVDTMLPVILENHWSPITRKLMSVNNPRIKDISSLKIIQLHIFSHYGISFIIILISFQVFYLTE
jgi:hypothetical protein